MEVRSAGVLVLLVSFVLAACTAGPESPEGAVAVPIGHPATELMARAANLDEFSAAAQLANLAFVCGKGAVPRPWEVCMLSADGVVAVVGFGDTTGIVVRVTGASHDNTFVPLGPDIIYGVTEFEGEVHILIENAGREIGRLDMTL